MKEVKFRAWDEEERRFWYFDLQEVLERHLSYVGSWDRKIAIGKKMQYVGVKDMNGMEVYEGDIIKCFDKYLPKYNVLKYVGEVYYDNECMSYCIMNRFSREKSGANTLTDIEVIGNIYENPELLEDI